MNMIIIAFLLISTLLPIRGDSLPTCQPSDFHFEYTECDSSGGRWRVSVPEPGKCVAGNPNPPVRGKSCEFTCDAGQYLDMESQECKSCPSGEYSLGGGARYDEWNKLPKEFTTKTESFDHSFGVKLTDVKINCTGTEWTAKGDFVASFPGQCASSLIYTANLVKTGSVTFEYQYPDNPESSSMFQFKVKNDQCQSVGDDDDGHSFPAATKDGEFAKINVPLKTGLNVIVWRTIGFSSHETTTKQKPVMIRKIEITGVAYTSQCTKCRNGTYSSEKSEFCTPCHANSYSGHGAASCTPCDAKTQYSRKGATKCLPRPPCSERDFYEVQAPCNKEKKTFKEYKWVEPQICSMEAVGAVKLPSAGALQPCPPCNPGMEDVNGKCQFCPENKYSNGSVLCKPCPASTSPMVGIEYKWWNEMPPNITSNCITFSEEDCVSESGWKVSGDHIHTHFGRGDDAYLILMFKVGGFKGASSSKEQEIATIEFLFETNCTGKCEMIFLSDDSGHSNIIQTWSGKQKKQLYSYSIRSSEPVTFTWAFEHSDWSFMESDEEPQEFAGDVAKIYSIKVTNTLTGGAAKCQACPKGVHKNTCIPCPNGHYINPNDTTCQPCPPNTVIPNGNSWGLSACKECGKGLHAKEGKRCETDCKFTDGLGREFDFSSLKRPQFVKGSHLFTGTGTYYLHGFNISLCSSDGHMATCKNNVSSSDSKNVRIRTVSSPVCRTTLVPDRESGTVIMTQPISIGDYVTKIVNNVSLTAMYKEEGFNMTGMENDIHFYLASDQTTSACTKGRTTIISLRCDIKEEEQGTIDLPPKCADGTCDGCTFHFLWRTQAACPVCRKEDAGQIIGECKNGKQLIHFTPPSNCIMKQEKLTPEEQACTVQLSALPFALQIGIPVGVGVGVLLLIVVIYCWHKNRSLEVKYMKLVEHSGPNYDGELPGVDSCALEDGEEEQYDSVAFKESRGVKFFKKLRGKKNKDDENPFEPINSEKIPLT